MISGRSMCFWKAALALLFMGLREMGDYLISSNHLAPDFLKVVCPVG